MENMHKKGVDVGGEEKNGSKTTTKIYRYICTISDYVVGQDQDERKNDDDEFHACQFSRMVKKEQRKRERKSKWDGKRL